MTQPTTVLNVSRLTRDQRAALVADPNFVYVGRAFAGWPGSVFGNMFKVGGSPYAAACKLKSAGVVEDFPGDSGPLTAAQAVACYRACWTATLGRREKIRRELKGRRLGCWCLSWTGVGEPSGICHALVLAQIAESSEIATSP